MLRKAYWYFIMYLAIPFDYLGWNLIFGASFGYISLKECVKANKMYYTLVIQKGINNV